MGLLKEGIFEPREYQQKILSTAIKKNTLCVLPTGLGKTNIAIMLTAHRLEKYPNSKVLVVAPTRPLINQHHKVFLKSLTIDENETCVLTGVIPPMKRTYLYKEKRLIFATPQVIENDIKNGALSLRPFSLLVIDEAHHAIGGYAYPYIADRYMEEAENPRILALTASPGGTSERIKRICDNLGIETVEIRTEKDMDVAPWIKKRLIEFVRVPLPESFLRIKGILESIYREKLQSLKDMKFIRGRVYKRDLLTLQTRLSKEIKDGNKKAFSGVFVVSQLIKLEHALTLLETQSISVLEKYWKKLASDRTSAARNLMKDERVIEAMRLTHELFQKGSKHPKISKLCSIVYQQISRKPDSKIIVFANFRDTVKEIVSALSGIEGLRPVEFVGQKEGITQKEQLRRLQEFRSGNYNVLVCTSVGEEGLDIPEMDLAVFYEAVPSEIRAIQRRGRVGRQKLGRVVFLITQNTRDEAYLWSALHKEKTMKRVLYSLKESNQLKMYF